ncbi:hypothetical protein [Kitasatospora sp. NPDC057198]|uniref:hypothetical protein n=1 Tax=Kitasatospora sp. NPDC057198 TaxID=3346046 RepID=UPI003645C6B6
MKVHPLIAEFPMLSEAELLGLAEDIKTNGQYEPILLDARGTLLDGRNRLAACELAGVEPRFTTYQGDDPAHLIWISNALRRQLNQGQRAMILAKARSASKSVARADAEGFGISPARLSLATTVVKHAPALVDPVISGAMGLDAAYEQARKNKAEAKTRQAQYDRLRDQAPDLVGRLGEDDLTLAEALAELDRRHEEEELRAHVRRADTLRAADGDPHPGHAQLAEDEEIDWNEAGLRADRYLAQRRERLQQVQQALHLITDSWSCLLHLAHRPGSALTREALDGLAPEARALAERLIAREAETP